LLVGSYAGVYRVLLNLVGNAVKFTNKGSVTINVQLEQTASDVATVKIVIEDTGIGIPEDKLGIIFDRFTRLIPSYKGTFEGSGIGLYIVQRYIKTMQGVIHVTSEENKGSQFTVSLPFKIANSPLQAADHVPLARQFIKIENAADKSDASPAVASKYDSAQVKILLVEDNLTAQLMGSSLLSSMNFKVEVADCGEKALSLFDPGKYDLIFMDIGLPGIQGDAVTKLIRKMEYNTGFHVPIIALTAHTTDDININYLSAGMDSVLSKPLSRDQAKRIIENCFSSTQNSLQQDQCG
jgi:CheY-like chemotaxis protein/anti-sigma regulatory factor (Ser/Thr protein kinase)